MKTKLILSFAVAATFCSFQQTHAAVDFEIIIASLKVKSAFRMMCWQEFGNRNSALVADTQNNIADQDITIRGKKAMTPIALELHSKRLTPGFPTFLDISSLCPESDKENENAFVVETALPTIKIIGTTKKQKCTVSTEASLWKPVKESAYLPYIYKNNQTTCMTHMLQSCLVPGLTVFIMQSHIDKSQFQYCVFFDENVFVVQNAYKKNKKIDTQNVLQNKNLNQNNIPTKKSQPSDLNI